MKPLADKECVNCKKTFTPSRKWAIYCSKSCQMQHFYEKRTTLLESLEEKVARLEQENETLKEYAFRKREKVIIPKKESLFKDCDCCKKKIDINNTPYIKKTFTISGGNANNKAILCDEECVIKYKSDNPNYYFKGK